MSRRSPPLRSEETGPGIEGTKEGGKNRERSNRGERKRKIKKVER